MLKSVETILKKKNVLYHKNQGITIVKVEAQPQGLELAKEIICEVLDKKMVLYLSGGSTPKTLYNKLAQEIAFNPGAVGLVDERYGKPFHAKSNQLMIRETGLIRYLQIRDIPFYPILQGLMRTETAENYDDKIRELNAVFPKSVAILGIGEDGHTAGIPSQNIELRIKNFESDKHSLVTEYDDTTEKYGERVTMTFLALEMIDLLIVLAFGSAKQNSLEVMFGEGSVEEIPARFYKRPEIARKTLLITDQSV